VRRHLALKSSVVIGVLRSSEVRKSYWVDLFQESDAERAGKKGREAKETGRPGKVHPVNAELKGDLLNFIWRTKRCRGTP